MSDREQAPPETADRAGAAGATAYGAPSPSGSTAPEDSSTPGTGRHADPAAALLLFLAGIAAGISLLLRWLSDDDVTGLTLVRNGFSALGEGVGELIGTGYVQPVTIALGGGVLFLLGLPLLVPARGHRVIGLLALVVALLVTLAVLVPLAIAGWDLGFFGIGFWFAIAVAVLGLLGGGKALLTRVKRS